MLIVRITEEGSSRHPGKHPGIARGLGFETIPHRTTIGNEEITDLISEMIPMPRPGLPRRGHSGDSTHLGANQIAAVRAKITKNSGK